MPNSLIYGAGNFIAPSDLTLPYFHDSTKVNAMYHLRQLDEYIRLKTVPSSLQLATALRMITDPLAADWVSTVSPSIHNYDQFKLAFKRNIWSASK
jgi:hypothetical protein